MTIDIPPGRLEAFLEAASLDPGSDCEVRRLGTDADMVRLILERIRIGEKTMTFSLPWIAAQEGRPAPAPGQLIAMVDADAEPAVLVRLTQVEELAFGDVDERHLAREGVPMRRVAAWKPLHEVVWNGKLAPLGRQVDDAMPVWAEYFDVLHMKSGDPG